MVTPDPALTEAFVSAFRAERVARQRTRELCTLLARKFDTTESAARAIVGLVGISAVCGFLHEAVKPWVEVDGVDWQALVAAATGKETVAPELVPSKAAHAFGYKLRELRIDRDLEIDVLAAHSEIDVGRFREIDGGCSEPDIVEVFKIARPLDITPSALMKHFEDALSTSNS